MWKMAHLQNLPCRFGGSIGYLIWNAIRKFIRKQRSCPGFKMNKTACHIYVATLHTRHDIFSNKCYFVTPAGRVFFAYSRAWNTTSSPFIYTDGVDEVEKKVRPFFSIIQLIVKETCQRILTEEFLGFFFTWSLGLKF